MPSLAVPQPQPAVCVWDQLVTMESQEMEEQDLCKTIPVNRKTTCTQGQISSIIFL